MNVTCCPQQGPVETVWPLIALPAALVTNLVMSFFAKWERQAILSTEQDPTWALDEPEPLAGKVEAVYERTCRLGLALGSLGTFLSRNPLSLALASVLCARTTQAQPSGSLEWSYPGVTFDLAVNGSIVMAHGKGTFVALNAATGQPLWNQTAKDQLIFGNRVYLLNDAGLFAVDYFKGEKLWSSPIEGTHIGISQDGTTLYGYSYGIEGSLSALHSKTGELLWDSFNGSGINSLLIVKGRICIIPSATKGLYALNASTGKQLWNFSTDSLGPSFQVSALSVVEDKVLVAYVSLGWNTLLNALSLFTGEQLWVGMLPVVDNPLIYHTSVQIGGGNELIVSSVTDTWGQNQSTSASCIAVTNASTGQLIFNTSWAEALPFFTPLLNGAFYWCSSGGESLQAMNGSTGTLLWQLGLSCASSAPIAINNSIYVNSANALSSIDATTGHPLWQLTHGNYSGPMLYAAEIVYLGNTGEEKILAFEAQTGRSLWNSPILSALDQIKSLAIVQEKLFVSTDRALLVLHAGPGSLPSSTPLLKIVLITTVAGVSISGLVLGIKRIQKHPHRTRETTELNEHQPLMP